MHFNILLIQNINFLKYNLILLYPVLAYYAYLGTSYVFRFCWHLFVLIVLNMGEAFTVTI